MTFDKGPLSTLDYHQSMLTDSVRVAAYRDAIHQTVRPGDVVLDLGTGTGVLAGFACQAGAARVYAIESGPILEVARRNAAQNGLQDRILFREGLSTEVELPEPVDVLITETIGSFGLDEGLLGYAMDARRRLLRPDARILPVALSLHAVPVEVPNLYASIEQWDSPVAGLDCSLGRTFAVNNPHWVTLGTDAFLSEPQRLCRLALARIDTDRLDSRVRFTATRPGTLHGVGGWFSAELSPGVGLTNAPPLRTPNWRHAFLPIARPCALDAGDRIDLRVQVRGNGAFWRWELVWTRPQNGTDPERALGRFDHTTLAGQMLSAEALRRQAADYRPDLSDLGRTDHRILGLMDGSRTLESIAALVFKDLPGRFRDPEQALARVRKLALRYG